MKKARIFIILFTALILILMLSACQNKNDYTITFDSNGGSNVYEMETDGKSIVNLPYAPVKEGYSFKGWYLDNDTFKSRFRNDTLLNNPVSSDFTLYAKWQRQSFRVSFYANGGLLISGDKRQTIEYGDPIEPPVIEKEGYDFIGWDKELTNIIENTPVFALYAPKEFTVTLDKQGGSGGPSTIKVEYDEILPELTAPTRTNYKFGGYYSEKYGKGDKYYDEDMLCVNIWNIESNATLYAKWYQEITFDKQGGSQGDDRAEAVIGQDMPQCEAPVREGHSFMGYYSEEDGQGTLYYDADMESMEEWTFSNGITLYAYWEVNDYTIELDKQGGTNSADDMLVTYGQDMPFVQAPQRSGYVFQGYYPQPYGVGEPYYDENMDSLKVWDKDEDSILYAFWILQQGTDGLNYELSASIDKYKVIGYIGSATEVVIPTIYNGKPVTEIANNAFYRCVNIEKVIIPDSITNIGDRAFYECVSMIKLDLYEQTLAIGEYAFYHCIGLTEVIIPNSVTTIGKGAFFGCGNLENLELGEGLAYIEESVFENCISLNNIVIPNNIIGIGEKSFANNLSLSNITLSQNLTIMGEYAFENCPALKQIIFPDGLTSIGDGAFYSCDNLNNVSLPISLKYIGKDAFNIKNLKSVIVNNIIPCVIGKNSFDNNFAKSANIYVPNGSLISYKNAINWSSYESNIFSKDLITDNFVISENTLLQYIGNEETITVPNTVAAIDSYAFSFVFGDIVFEEESVIEDIGNNAFSYYNGKNITIPEGVESIGEDAFLNCYALENLTIFAIAPPTLGGEIVANENLTIYVPSANVDDYKTHIDWSSIADIITAIAE